VSGCVAVMVRNAGIGVVTRGPDKSNTEMLAASNVVEVGIVTGVTRQRVDNVIVMGEWRIGMRSSQHNKERR